MMLSNDSKSCGVVKNCITYLHQKTSIYTTACVVVWHHEENFCLTPYAHINPMTVN